MATSASIRSGEESFRPYPVPNGGTNNHWPTNRWLQRGADWGLLGYSGGRFHRSGWRRRCLGMGIGKGGAIMRFIAALFIIGLIVVGGIFLVMSVQNYTALHHQTMMATALMMFFVGIVGLGALLTNQSEH